MPQLPSDSMYCWFVKAFWNASWLDDQLALPIAFRALLAFERFWASVEPVKPRFVAAAPSAVVTWSSQLCMAA